MAKFNFDIRRLVGAAHARPAAAARALPALDHLLIDAAPELVELVKGPGWFDSSWDLGHGLVVREGLPSDAGLNEWLEVWLRSDTCVAPADPYGIEGLELA